VLNGISFLILGLLSVIGGLVFDISWLRIVLIILGVIWLLTSFYYFHKHIVEKNTPLLTAQAKILSKVSEQAVDGWGGTVSTKNSYFVVFEFSDGNRKKLSVNMSQYALLAENDTGVLEYKDISSNLKFINFKRQT